MKKLSLKEKALYCLGSLGMGMVTATHMMFLVWFFIHDTGANLPYYIKQEPVFWVFTIMGLLLALKTVFDAISDPIIGNISDKINPKKGARTTMLRWGAIPFGVSYFMVYMVPNEFVSNTNVIWIACWLVAATFFLTVYSVNHEALMAKITRNGDDRINLGTFASASWFIGLVLVMVSSNVWGPVQNILSVDKVTSIRITFGIASAIGAVAMLFPSFIDEKKYEVVKAKKAEKVRVLQALAKTMKYPNFRRFVLANTMYTSATVIFESGLLFFVTVLAVLGEGTAGNMTVVIGAVTLAMYPLINILTKKRGRKFVLLVSFVSYVATFVTIALMSPNPSPWLYLVIIAVVAPFSQAGFGILPVVIASDNADHMIRRTGEDMTGMYMAASGFFRKLGSTIALIALTSFLQILGKEVGADLGIRVAVYFAGALSILGFIIMKGYNEKEVMSTKECELGDK